MANIEEVRAKHLERIKEVEKTIATLDFKAEGERLQIPPVAIRNWFQAQMTLAHKSGQKESPIPVSFVDDNTVNEKMPRASIKHVDGRCALIMFDDYDDNFGKLLDGGIMVHIQHFLNTGEGAGMVLNGVDIGVYPTTSSTTVLPEAEPAKEEKVEEKKEDAPTTAENFWNQMVNHVHGENTFVNASYTETTTTDVKQKYIDGEEEGKEIMENKAAEIVQRLQQQEKESPLKLKISAKQAMKNDTTGLDWRDDTIKMACSNLHSRQEAVNWIDANRHVVRNIMNDIIRFIDEDVEHSYDYTLNYMVTGNGIASTSGCSTHLSDGLDMERCGDKGISIICNMLNAVFHTMEYADYKVRCGANYIDITISYR